MVRGTAIRTLVASSCSVLGSASTVRQLSSVKAPGCPGATSRTLP